MTVKERTESNIEEVKLCERIYGCIPEKPIHLTVDTVSEDRGFAAGTATLREMRMIFDFEGETESLPMISVIPNSVKKHPAIIYLSEGLSVPDRYLPAEEIAERGYAIFIISFDKVRESKIKRSSVLPTEPNCTNKKRNAPGELALLAWSAMRVTDFITKLDCIDKSKIAVAGHGLLGRGALLTAAFDERVSFVIANDSLSLGLCEDISHAVNILPELFSNEYSQSDIDTDPHGILLLLCKDKHILVGTAEDDPRSNPNKELEYLASLIKSGVPKERISYHSRNGSHYLSRADWKVYLDYIDKI